MKKVFIDCGANIGQSISAFTGKWEDSSEYEIHSFEPHPKLKDQVIETARRLELKNFTFHSEAISNTDGEFNFYLAGNDIGSSLEIEKDNVSENNKVVVTTIDLAKWLTNNFSKDDYIILKIDIEGSEFKVMKHLFETKAIEYIDELYLEIHSHAKVKINSELRDEVTKLISECTVTKIYTDKSNGLDFV